MFHRLRLVLLLVLVTAVCVITTQVVSTQEAPPRPARAIEELPRLPGAEVGKGEVQSPATAAPTITLPWSKRTFQSYRDGNWEIYVSNDDGFEEARLTVHGAIDMHPRLNRGATRIAFVSKRDGSYEIYTMNVDGSGVTRLTFTGSDNVYPAWSPDGTKIAFQSYRDGQAEIYVMNANGSGQTRLTVDAGFDGYPAWSPDGSKIAFSSNRSGQVYIHVMNTDGSGVTQLSNQIYSYNPVWSPDGSRIAYDADLDNDGWQELWVMDANGANQQMKYDPYGQTDAWAHSWSPDGRYIAYTLIRFTQYQGVWYWVDAFLEAFDISDLWNVRLGNIGLDWNPDWQTTDNVPPVSAVQLLPEISQVPEFAVTWSGTDDNSGLTYYDVQYRLGHNGVWQNWQTNVQNTSAHYTATPGATVFFRSRAHDASANVEAWPSTPDTGTSFYSWALWGRLTDNRGAPLQNVLPTITPDPFINTATNKDGDYRSLLMASGAHTLDVIRTGYGDVTTSTLNQAVVSQLYLPPVNNQIVNGNFEESPALNNWQASGILPVTTAFTHHTGSQAAQLGSLACTYPCLTMGEVSPIQDMWADDMTADSRGNVHVLWLNNQEIKHSIRDTNGVWTTESPVTGTYGVSDVGLLATPDDLIHAVYIEGKAVKYATRPITGTWTSWQTIATLSSTAFNDFRSYVHKMTVDPQGHLHIFIAVQGQITGQTAFYLQQQPTGDWTYFEMHRYSLVMGLGSDGTAHFAWISFNSYSGEVQLAYQNRLANGKWSNIINIPLFDGQIVSLESLAVAPNGTVHVLAMVQERLYEPSQAYHFVRLPDGNWSHSLAHFGQFIGTHNDSVPNSAMAVDSQNKVHFIFWENAYSMEKAFYRQWQPGSGWQSVEALPGSVMRPPLLVIDQFDRLHILLEELSSAKYGHSSIATSGGTAELTQTLDIPADMPAPTLAFMGRRFGDVMGDSSGLELFVTSGMTTTAVALLPGSADWSHYWADMSPWAGQTVTVQFKLTQTVNDPRVAFVLDDVSLGPAHPDIWFSGESPQTAIPGDDMVYQLHYGNRGGVVAQDVVLTATLPAELTFVSSTVPVTVTDQTLVWNFGDLIANSPPQSILFTVTLAADAPFFQVVTIPAMIRSSTPEIEVSDNTLHMGTFIGRRTYLPLLVR